MQIGIDAAGGEDAAARLCRRVMTTRRDWRAPVDRDLGQHSGGSRQVQADVKRRIRLDPVTEVILQVIVNPEGGTYRPLAGSSRVPGQPDARLKQLLRVILKQAGWADHRIRLEHPR